MIEPLSPAPQIAPLPRIFGGQDPPNPFTAIKDAINSAIEKIKAFIESIKESVRSAISNAVSSIRDTIRTWVDSAKSAIYLRVGDAISAVWKGVSSVKEKISSTISTVTKTISEKFEWLGGKIREIIDKIGNVASEVWEKIPVYLKPGPEGIFARLDAIKTGFETVGHKIKGGTEAAIKKAQEAVLSAINTLYDGVQSWFHGIIEGLKSAFQWLAEQFKQIGEWILKPFREWIPQGFQWLGQRIIDWFKSYWTLLMWLGEKIAWFFTEKLPEAFKRAAEWLFGKIRAGAEWFFESILNFLEKRGRVTPDRAPNIAKTGWTIAIMGAGGLGVATLMGQLARWWSNLGAGPLAAMAADMAQFSRFTGAIAGVLATAYFAQPLKYYVNNLARPYLPDFKTMHDALGRGKISDEEFLRHMGWNGIGEEWFPIYKALAARPVSAFHTRYLAEAEIVDVRMLYDMMIDAGYSETHAEYLAKAFEWAAIRPYQRGIEMVLTRAYREGYITMDIFSRELEKAWQLRDKKALLQLRAEWEYFVDRQADLLRIMQESYRNGLITEDEFIDSLVGAGFNPQRVEDYLWREQVRKLGKMKKKEKTAG